MPLEIYDPDYIDFYDDVKCLGDLGEKWCIFKWRIYNLQLNPQETFQSPIFSTRLLPKTHWFMEVKALSPGDLKSIKISLRRLKNYENAVSVIDVIYKVISDEDINASDKRTYEYNNENFQSDRYCYSALFKKSKTSYVTLECRLRPNKVMIRNVDHGKYDETLAVDLRQLLQTKEFYDTIIRVDNQEFFAHFAILCARIPKFVPPGEKKESNKYIIEVNDLPASVVKEILKYAYTGQAYVDLESFSSYKDVLIRYNNFFQQCCWDDNPTATTFFNYETDSLWWKLKGYHIKSNLGSKKIELLKLYPKELEFSLDILESQEGGKNLILGFNFCTEQIPKPTILSCTLFLLDDLTKETFELGETETLLHSNLTKGSVKLCSFIELERGHSSLNVTENDLVLRTDFKFCYGSSKSSLKNLYNGPFDISQCTSCAKLSAEMYNLFHFVKFHDVSFITGRSEVKAHKAILIARWRDANQYNLREDSKFRTNNLCHYGLSSIFDYVYSGIRRN